MKLNQIYFSCGNKSLPAPHPIPPPPPPPTPPHPPHPTPPQCIKVKCFVCLLVVVFFFWIFTGTVSSHTLFCQQSFVVSLVIRCQRRRLHGVIWASPCELYRQRRRLHGVIWALPCENVSSGVCEQRRPRSACASA